MDNFFIEKIAEVDLYICSVPLRRPFEISGGLAQRDFQPIVVVITNESGFTGISTLDNFTTSVYDNNGIYVSWVNLVEDYLPYIIKKFNKIEDRTIFDFYNILHKIRDYNPFVVSALEMALWDLLGKQENIACHSIFYDIFLGFLREFYDMSQSKFEFKDYSKILDRARRRRLEMGLKSKISIGLQKEDIKESRIQKYRKIIDEALNQGIDAIKLKITPGKRYNTNLIHLIRDEYSDLTIDTDANSSFLPQRDCFGRVNLNKIINIYNSMDKFNIRMHEQPSIFKRDHMQIFFELAKSINIPLCLDESIHSFYEVQHLISEFKGLEATEQQVDKIYVNIKIHRTGGLIDSIISLANILWANKADLSVNIVPWAGYMPDQELSSNAALHLFSLPIQTSHTDITNHRYWFTDSLFDQTISVEKGKVKLINGPGFGLYLNHDKVNKRKLREKSFKFIR
ncbi:MAG: hypothetical protein GF364_06765 [Candidatus Lokiarchaeota archaeon]|nr:hypothetical protein [Candidatus Lokiarchaeota archaeon]